MSQRAVCVAALSATLPCQLDRWRSPGAWVRPSIADFRPYGSMAPQIQRDSTGKRCVLLKRRNKRVAKVIFQVGVIAPKHIRLTKKIWHALVPSIAVEFNSVAASL